MKVLKSWIPGEMKPAETAFMVFLALSISTILLKQEYGNPIMGLMILSWFFVKKPYDSYRAAIGDPWVVFSMGFFLLYLIGMLYTENIASGLSQLETKLGLLFFPFFIASYGRWNNEKRNFILSLLTLAVSSLAMVCLVVAFMLSTEKTGSLFDLDSSFFVYNQLTKVLFIQPIYFSLFILFLLVVWQNRLITEWYGLKAGKRGFWLALQVFLLIFLFLLSSRTSILTYLIWSLIRTFDLMVFKKRRATAVLALIIEMGLGAILLTQIDVSKTRFSEAIDPDSSYEKDEFAGRSLRIEKWKCSFETWAKNPVLGVGTGDENAELLKCFEEKNIAEAIRWQYNSHNQYLSTLTQVGIPGILLLLAMVFYPIFYGVKNRDLTVFAIGLVFFLCIGSETMLSRRFGVLYTSLVMSVWLVGLSGFGKRNK